MSQMQYEIIMTDIGHTMQRDGEFIVFGDVMFALPNNGRSRISSYGEGPDKQSARQSLIERAIEHLHRDERMSAKRQQQDFVYYAESKKSKKKPSKSASPVEVVNNRAGFFDDEQDKEYFGFGFIVGGIIVGVLGTIFGNIFSELVLDEMRVKKFGYRDSSQKDSSFWELDSE